MNHKLNNNHISQITEQKHKIYTFIIPKTQYLDKQNTKLLPAKKNLCR